MKRVLSVLALVALGVSGAGREGKDAEVEILEVTAHRQSGHIMLDGRVLAHRARPIRGLVLLFDFMASGGGVITTQKYRSGEKSLEAGDDLAFRAQLRDAPRAVRYRINAEDFQGHELRVGNPGPFPIE